MNINDAFPTKFIKASDLQGRAVTVKIATVKMDEVEKGKMKPILYFFGKERGLALNKINSNTIASLYGPETDNWIGQPIELFEAMVDYQGKTVSAVRIRAPRQPLPNAAGHAVAPQPAPPPQTMYDDQEPPF